MSLPVRIAALALVLLAPSMAYASEGASEGGHGGNLPLVFLFVGIMILFARVGALAERWKQPAVLGELVMGLVLGALAFVPVLHGIDMFKENGTILAFAEFGVLLLLFRTGLESNVKGMARVGVPAFLVAVVGVVLPFIGGYLAAKALITGISFETALFLGATLTATSVGITARVFQDLKFSGKERDIVLGAAVIDDIMGLLILAIVAGIVSGGSVEAGTILALTAKALAFLILSIALGQILAPKLGSAFSKIHTGQGMKMALALLFMVAFAYGAAELAGLAPIVGAFAAGLVLDPVHFKDFAAPETTEKVRAWVRRLKGTDHADTNAVRDEMDRYAHEEAHGHLETYVDYISSFFVPLFFVYTGMQVNLGAFGNMKVVGIALAVTAVAIVGKVLAGFVAGKGVDRKLVGSGMVPRGEVGLIFANVGKQLGVVNDEIFAIAVIVVILTTLITPPVLGVLIRRRQAAPSASAGAEAAA